MIEADQAEFTLHELTREVAREIALREAVYPGLIARKKMSPAMAQRRINLMKAVAARLRAEAEGEEAWRLV